MVRKVTPHQKQREMTDFHKHLAEFRELTRDFKGHGNSKTFNNLQEFRDYYENIHYIKNPNYKKKTDKKYKKSGIPSKIPFSREENPKEWTKQYGWFRTHPEATVYAPLHGRKETHVINPLKCSSPERRIRGWAGGRKPTEITKKITVKSKDNVKEYQKQYRWFSKNPEATVYAPQQKKEKTGDRKPSGIPKKIPFRKTDNPKEYNRQWMWFKNHPDETVCPPRKTN